MWGVHSLEFLSVLFAPRQAILFPSNLPIVVPVSSQTVSRNGMHAFYNVPLKKK